MIVTDAGGSMIEQGEASPNPKNKLQWNYAATVANPVIAGTKIQATAYDRPDNEGTLEIVL